MPSIRHSPYVTPFTHSPRSHRDRLTTRELCTLLATVQAMYATLVLGVGWPRARPSLPPLAWPEGYSYATAMNGLADEQDLRLRFDVLTKTKQPELHRYWTTRDRAANVRLYRLAAEVLSAVEADVFPPRVGWTAGTAQSGAGAGRGGERANGRAAYLPEAGDQVALGAGAGLCGLAPPAPARSGLPGSWAT
jgi:hypothetical protein